MTRATTGMVTVAVVPAGGSGRRMGRSRPKQYLSVRGVPLIVHTLRGVGTTRFTIGNGIQSSAFGLLAGTDIAATGDLFGWIGRNADGTDASFGSIE
jgi:hypothetical protein